MKKKQKVMAEASLVILLLGFILVPSVPRFLKAQRTARIQGVKSTLETLVKRAYDDPRFLLEHGGSPSFASTLPLCTDADTYPCITFTMDPQSISQADSTVVFPEWETPLFYQIDVVLREYGQQNKIGEPEFDASFLARNRILVLASTYMNDQSASGWGVFYGVRRNSDANDRVEPYDFKLYHPGNGFYTSGILYADSESLGLSCD